MNTKKIFDHIYSKLVIDINNAVYEIEYYKKSNTTIESILEAYMFKFRDLLESVENNNCECERWISRNKELENRLKCIREIANGKLSK